MAIYNLFSKRQKKARGEEPDVFQYKEMPRGFRVQVIKMFDDILGNEHQYRGSWEGRSQSEEAYQAIVEVLRREYGVFELADTRSPRHDFREELANFILNEGDVEKVLDAIELGFRVGKDRAGDYYFLQRRNGEAVVEDVTAELNERFKSHALGFRYEDGVIVRIDSTLIHAEITKPSLRLLCQSGFDGPEQEFHDAYDCFRKGKQKDAMNNALKALESTLKVICAEKKWKAKAANPTAKDLLDVVFDQGLIPAFWQSAFGGLRSILENGVPTGRNRLSGHGQGPEPVEVPEHIAAFVLHMTATAIVFLVSAARQKT